jgi:hypothetical protein
MVNLRLLDFQKLCAPAALFHWLRLIWKRMLERNFKVFLAYI